MNRRVPRMRRRMLVLFVLWGMTAVLAGCGERISGRYDEVSGIGSMEFRDNGTVFVTIHDMTVQAEYAVDGDRVIITGSRGTQIYAREGETLIGGLGIKYVRQ